MQLLSTYTDIVCTCVLQFVFFAYVHNEKMYTCTLWVKKARHVRIHFKNVTLIDMSIKIAIVLCLLLGPTSSFYLYTACRNTTRVHYRRELLCNRH